MERLERKPERVVLFKDLPAYTGLQVTQIEKLINLGEFPQPIKLSARRRAILERDLVEWQQSKLRERAKKK
jgi:predicted DNA-binding transcriptional regulator AlpA